MRNNLVFFVCLLLLTGLVSCNDKEGKKSFFKISNDPATLIVGLEGFSETFTINSNTDWKFVNPSGQTWATIMPMKGTGNGKITITVEPHQGLGRRTATFNVVPNGVKNSQIDILQGDDQDPNEDSEFPILAWTGIDVKFPPMKEAGFNLYLQWYDNLNEVLKALNDAYAGGIKLITSCPELKNNTEATVNSLMNHPALYGYHLDDEPEVSEFQSLSRWTAQIQAIDSKHPCYINLYPNWAWGGADKYAANVAAFLEQVPVPFLSFDYYPIVQINGAPSILRPDWYRNLEDISAAAKAKKIPFWAFVLALSHTLDASHFYPVPTLAELRLQVFSNLAYGAQGIQYFTYWGIYQSGPTQVYDRVKTVNQEIRNLSSVFLHANVISVWHTGNQLPNGTRPINQLPSPIKSLITSDGGAVVSFLEKGNDQYLAVVNRDYRNPMSLTVSFDVSVKKVEKSGSIIEANSGTIQVEAGDMIIYTWKK